MHITDTNKILVVDLEATCWDGPKPEGQKNEIIEIGIALLDTETGEISNNKGILVKPTVSVVSPFCTELTTITQELLDKEGIAYDEACDYLHNHFRGLPWASYGEYDRRMMRDQCKKRKIENPLSSEHTNVKELFAEKLNNGNKIGMDGALDILAIPLEGVHHRGVDDAKNIAKILFECLK